MKWRAKNYDAATIEICNSSCEKVDLIKEFGSEEYEFTFRKTRTFDVIDDVKNLRSEIGLIYLSGFNETIISKLLKESDLVFNELFVAKPHVFLFRQHPLSNKKVLSVSELEDYPRLKR